MDKTTLTTNQFVNIGAFVGSINNNATVTGPGSVWTNNGFLAIGAGTLNITNGGVVIDNGANGSGYVGDFVGSTQPGVVTVTGVGSQWNNSTFVSVGLANNGTMTIGDAGWSIVLRFYRSQPRRAGNGNGAKRWITMDERRMSSSLARTGLVR